jgi:hypothetical protein
MRDDGRNGGDRRELKWREKVHTLDLPAHAAP